MRAGEARVAQIRRAAGENLLVRRLHVRVRAHHRAHLAVQHPRERDLLRGRLGMEIHEDDSGLFAQPFDFLGGEEKRIFQWRHESAALQIQNRD